MSDRFTDEEEPQERPVINEEPEDAALADELARLEDRASELEERARDLADTGSDQAGSEPEPGLDDESPAETEPETETDEELPAETGPETGEEPPAETETEPETESGEEPEADSGAGSGMEPEAEVESTEEIAEEEEAEAEQAEAAFEWPEELPERRRALSWPFWVYLAAWTVFAGVWTYLLWQTSLDGRVVEDPLYPTMIWSGIGLAAVGPVLSIIVWLASRGRFERGERAGLFARSLLLGALVTLGGVALWWVGLLALDYARLGSL